MRKLSPILASAAFVLFSASAIAATDTKTIDIEVIQGTFAELTGSAVDGNTNVISMNNITGNSASSLGTLGVNSNGSNCELEFSTLNNYTLLHESSGETLKKFSLSYLGESIYANAAANAVMPLDSCEIADSSLTFSSYGDTPAVIAAGTYKDTVTITLTAE